VGQETRKRVVELCCPVTAPREIGSLSRMNDDRTNIIVSQQRRDLVFGDWTSATIFVPRRVWIGEQRQKQANKAASAATKLWSEGAGPRRMWTLPNMVRTQSRGAMLRARARIRDAVTRNKQGKLTALLHHISIDVLRAITESDR
jgi:hypothetical protein